MKAASSVAAAIFIPASSSLGPVVGPVVLPGERGDFPLVFDKERMLKRYCFDRVVHLHSPSG